MKYKLLSTVALAAMFFASMSYAADNSVKSQKLSMNNTSHSAATMKNTAAAKKISKVSDINNMADDQVVYIQGYLIQNLGDENYVFQDDSGTINVEIDDDLMQNTIAPETLVWIVATVDKEGDVTSLDAEELQLVPDTTAAN